MLLKDLCDVRYLDAFLSALKHRDGGILRNAHDGILELLSNHGSIIDSKYTEILMNLPDKEWAWDRALILGDCVSQVSPFVALV